ncbi:hypothetical protein SAMN04489732_13138 [Amycolatopsis saalfeldensis]|uniref:Uncharacterized protein n=2 Tax=Amycolatopsis saalfeldensis TaxID=394193 RepID=A0A1H8YNR8_9PSEU|nr:hypothetical protein SAMN04489732_13138 [Amycolatopsis saalfeldensis]
MARRGITARVTAGSIDEESGGTLWNPHLSLARRVWEIRRTVFSREVPFLVLGGALLVVIGFVAGMWGFALLGAFIVFCGLGTGLANLRCLTLGQCAHPDGLCRLDERPGIALFRSRDFTGMGSMARGIASRAIDAVGELHDTPAHAWLDPGLPSTAHRLAWEVLHCLDRTRRARTLAFQLAQNPAHAVLAGALAEAIDALDHRLDEAAQSLSGCAVLAREWTRALHDAELRRDGEQELRSTRMIAPDALTAATESLLQQTFCRVTAARDLTDSGPFPWEQPRTTRFPSAAGHQFTEAARRFGIQRRLTGEETGLS